MKHGVRDYKTMGSPKGERYAQDAVMESSLCS